MEKVKGITVAVFFTLLGVLLAIGFQNCGRGPGTKISVSSLGPEVIDDDSDLDGDDVGAQANRAGMSDYLSKLATARYKCVTPRGNVFFHFNYAGISDSFEEYYYFRPAGTDGSSTTGCTDVSSIANPTQAVQKCVFFETASRWSLELTRPADGALPVTVNAQIANSYDCANAQLQSGVTVDICQAKYDCALDSTTAQNAWPIVAARPAESVYKCVTGRGDVYFAMSYLDSNMMEFQPVGGDRCNDLSLLDKAPNSLAKCGFFATYGRWSFNLPLDPGAVAPQLPATINRQIATEFDCKSRALAAGVSVAECSANYTCTKIK